MSYVMVCWVQDAKVKQSVSSCFSHTKCSFNISSKDAIYRNVLMEYSHVLWVKGQPRHSRGCVHLKKQVKRTARGRDTGYNVNWN